MSQIYTAISKSVLNDNSSTKRFQSSLSTISLISSHTISDEHTGEKDDTTSFDANYDYDSHLDKETFWNEHNIHSTEKTRILNIIDVGVNSIGVALSLEILMENKDFISTHLTKDEYKMVINCYENYWKKEKYKRSKVEFPKKDAMENVYLCELINILCKRKDICSKARSIVSAQIDSGSIYNAFEEITTFFIKKLNTSIRTENNRNVFLVDVWNKNEKAKRKIQELEIILKRRQRAFSKLIREKLDYIRSHTNAVSALKMECIEQIKRNEKIIERKMINEVYENDTICKKLQEDKNRIQTECEILLEKHLRLEKDARKKNLKIETQLFSWMEKYDLEMMERQDRYDGLNRKYLDEKPLHDEIRHLFDEQQPIYEALMIEKHEYLDKIWNEKYQKFIRNLAAKRIQRFYRKYRKNVIKKRKAAQVQAARSYRKGKGSMLNKTSSKGTKSKSSKSSRK